MRLRENRRTCGFLIRVAPIMPSEPKPSPGSVATEILIYTVRRVVEQIGPLRMDRHHELTAKARNRQFRGVGVFDHAPSARKKPIGALCHGSLILDALRGCTVATYEVLAPDIETDRRADQESGGMNALELPRESSRRAVRARTPLTRRLE